MQVAIVMLDLIVGTLFSIAMLFALLEYNCWELDKEEDKMTALFLLIVIGLDICSIGYTIVTYIC